MIGLKTCCFSLLPGARRVRRRKPCRSRHLADVAFAEVAKKYACLCVHLELGSISYGVCGVALGLWLVGAVCTLPARRWSTSTSYNPTRRSPLHLRLGSHLGPKKSVLAHAILGRLVIHLCTCSFSSTPESHKHLHLVHGCAILGW